MGGIAAEPTVSAILPSAASAIPLPQVVSAGILAVDCDCGKPRLTRGKPQDRVLARGARVLLRPPNAGIIRAGAANEAASPKAWIDDFSYDFRAASAFSNASA